VHLIAVFPDQGASCRPAFRAVLALLSAGVTFLSAGQADAHPHVWIDVTVAPVFDGMGRLTAVHEKWTFDEPYTESIGPDLDVNKDGMLSDIEVQNAAKVGVLWFVPPGYFTRITAAGRSLATKPVQDFSVKIPGPGMVVEFTLPLVEPAVVPPGAGIDVFDPEYYVALAFADPDIDASLAPTSCQVSRRSQANLDPTAVMILRRLGLTTDPAILNDPAAGFPVRVAIDCK
jgi:ABC-type uncharacterized transport system substrate-binding protein